MTWYIPQLAKGQKPKHLGIAPTRADREQVKAWCLMGVTQKEMCARLGELYKIGRPISKATLLHHFRKDIPLKQKPGFRAKKKPVSRKTIQSIESEMARMIATVQAHKAKPRAQSEDED
jgi:hypothetical protein